MSLDIIGILTSMKMGEIKQLIAENEGLQIKDFDLNVILMNSNHSKLLKQYRKRLYSENKSPNILTTNLLGQEYQY